MPKTYSDDFRQKVIQSIEMDGLKKIEASQLFNKLWRIYNVFHVNRPRGRGTAPTIFWYIQ
jgi:hypothetical protein